VVTNQVFTPVVNLLPKNATLNASIVIGGKTVSLGPIKTNSIGTATLPAFKASKTGTYVIQMTSRTGAQYFIRVNVKVG